MILDFGDDDELMLVPDLEKKKKELYLILLTCDSLHIQFVYRQRCFRCHVQRRDGDATERNRIARRGTSSISRYTTISLHRRGWLS